MSRPLISNDDARRDWINEASDRDIVGVAQSYGAKLRRAGSELVGPCPACGGEDRFQINPGKRVFICRGAAKGGVIALVMHLEKAGANRACEILTGRPPPGRDASETPEVLISAEN